MPRPPLPVGQAGSINFTQARPGHWRARCRYRELSGKVIYVERSGSSRTAAQRALLAEIEHRRGLRVEALKPHHRVSVAFELYQEAVTRRASVGEIAATTADRYRHAISYAEPLMGALRLSEVSIGSVDHVFGQLADVGLSANTRRLIRAALTQAFDLALRHGAVTVNPVRHLSRITDRRRKAPRSLTAHQRRQLFAWLDGRDTPAQRLAHERGVPDMIRFLIGTGVRMGEMLAVTWGDVDLDGTLFALDDGQTVLIPTARISGNIVRVRGRGVVKHEGKTEQSLRTVPLPRFVVDVLRSRRPEQADPFEPVFPQPTRAGASLVWRDPNSVMRYIRDVREALDWPWLTTHVFRKTAATILHEAGASDLAIGEHIGHTDRASLLNVYLGTADVDPRLVNALDAAIVDT